MASIDTDFEKYVFITTSQVLEEICFTHLAPPQRVTFP
jgi:hypothetical protein